MADPDMYSCEDVFRVSLVALHNTAAGSALREDQEKFGFKSAAVY